MPSFLTSVLEHKLKKTNLKRKIAHICRKLYYVANTYVFFKKFVKCQTFFPHIVFFSHTCIGGGGGGKPKKKGGRKCT